MTTKAEKLATMRGMVAATATTKSLPKLATIRPRPKSTIEKLVDVLHLSIPKETTP